MHQRRQRMMVFDGSKEVLGTHLKVGFLSCTHSSVSFDPDRTSSHFD